MKALRRLLLKWLKVPPEPQPPPGSPDSLRIFRAAPAFYSYSIMRWAMKQVGAIVGFLLFFPPFGLTLGAIETLPFNGASWLQGVGITIFVLQAIGSFLLLRLNYELRWYMVSDRSLRIREGIFRIKEQTMTVANIQNMAVRQGPLQRLLGIADLHVRTAGGSGKEENSTKNRGGDPHLGALRGLDDAEGVRDLIASALRSYKDSGLGDPDDHHRVAALPQFELTAPGAGYSAGSHSADSHSAERAAARVLDEVRALRTALAAPE